MSDKKTLKKGCFDARQLKDFNKLRSLKTNDFEDIRLHFIDCTGLRDVLKTFQHVQKLDFTINNYNEDIKRVVFFPKLKNVHFGKVIPMNMNNFWKTFSNLEEVSIGNRGDNYDLFTSEFVNRVIGRNQNTLKVLRLLDVVVVASTYKRLRVPCQLEELEIFYFREESKEKICRSQEYSRKYYDKQKFMKQPGLIFYTKPEEITTFDNLTDILRSQKELKSLILDYAFIDSEVFGIITSKPHLRILRIASSEFLFDEINLTAKECFKKIRELYISHVSELSEKMLREILRNIKDVENLQIHCIWNMETVFDPLESRVLLPNLKEFKMWLNCRTNQILDSLEFTENLETVTAEIGSIGRVEEIFRTSSNIKCFHLESSAVEVADFVSTRFKKLEWFEWWSNEFSLQTVLYVLENASNIKRAKIYLYTDCSEQDKDNLNERLQTDFPGFYFVFVNTLEVHNKELDFKLRIGYHHFMLGGDW